MLPFRINVLLQWSHTTSIGYLILTPTISPSSYLKLPESFYALTQPTALSNPYMVKYNHDLAATLTTSQNAAPYTKQELVQFHAGNWVPEHLQSIALAYAGHQFGYYVPLLGDGRAVMLGELHTKEGLCWDMQLKGSGRTVFSRTGDGRAPLAAVLREYLISEAMHGFNIPTTRCLAITSGDERIYRTEGLVPLGVLTRIAASSLRVGSFEYAAQQKENTLLKQLAHYAIERHFPELITHQHPYIELFKAVLEQQARLISEWMGVGFIHGVMNTDNMTISGETIDYGPCAFMDEFDVHTVFSSIDIQGRYAYGNQAAIAQWNLARFRESLLPLFQDKNEDSSQQLQEILNTFSTRFHYYWDKKVSAKLGLFAENEQTLALIGGFFTLLQQYKPDFTNTFRLLAQAIDCEANKERLVKSLGNQDPAKQWVSNWVSYIKAHNSELETVKAQMNQINPVYIPRNHLVEKAINQFVTKNDRSLMDTLLNVFKTPYQPQQDDEYLRSLPADQERVIQTFCGT